MSITALRSRKIKVRDSRNDKRREDFLFDSMKGNMNLTEWPGRDVFSDGLPVMGCIRAGEIIPAAQKSPTEMHLTGVK